MDVGTHLQVRPNPKRHENARETIAAVGPGVILGNTCHDSIEAIEGARKPRRGVTPPRSRVEIPGVMADGPKGASLHLLSPLRRRGLRTIVAATLQAVSGRGSHMLTQQDNELLTRVGPGTPMGELMRRYWMPALLVLGAAGARLPAVEVRLLGEDLVAFRADRRPRRRRSTRTARTARAQPVLGPQRGGRPALRLPRLEVRRRRRRASTCRRSRRAATSRTRSRIAGLPDRTRSAASSGPTWARPRSSPRRRCSSGRRRPRRIAA